MKRKDGRKENKKIKNDRERGLKLGRKWRGIYGESE